MKNDYSRRRFIIRLFSTAIFCFVFTADYKAQTTINSALKKTAPNQINPAVKSSPAYAELLLRKTEREAELEGFLLDYTEEFPKVKEIKFELDLINKEMNKLAAVSPADAGKLTLALGKLMVRKTEIETDLWNLRRQYSDDRPEVKRAKRKVEVYERAIKEIL